MEYLRGMSLEEVVGRYGPLPPGRVVHILRQVCGALREAHAENMLHRDIKPGNVFAAYRGGVFDVAKLLDFGLVKESREEESSRLTQDGTIAGTPQFMSPEQANQQPVDARSDIYCLGAVGYFLLTGRPPFDDPRPLAVIIAHARDPVTPPAQYRPDLPEDLEQVILRCLAKEPAKRYQTALELKEALDACRDAGTWTIEDALRWWQENEKEIGARLAGVAARTTAPNAVASSVVAS
jgi:eukaryotic-like serine/threonine-protein kinase